MKHRRRNGDLVTCWECKEGHHSACLNYDFDFNDIIRCHCQCQPECECVLKPRRFHPSNKAWAPNDPRWD